MFREKLKGIWRDHGTKLLGWGSYSLGMLAFIDHETLKLIADYFGPLWGPHVLHVLLIVGGIMIAKRGRTNSDRQG